MQGRTIGDTVFLGRKIQVTQVDDVNYTITVDGSVTQQNLTANGVIGYLCNAMMNARNTADIAPGTGT